MTRFFSPLLIMMSVVVMVAALADRSASAELGGGVAQSDSEDVTICHPVTSREGDGVDVLVYRLSPYQTEIIEEHRAHGDLLLDDESATVAHACPGNVISVDRL